eukprot:1149563-Prymnesium_polylepis.1
MRQLRMLRFDFGNFALHEHVVGTQGSRHAARVFVRLAFPASLACGRHRLCRQCGRLDLHAEDCLALAALDGGDALGQLHLQCRCTARTRDLEPLHRLWAAAERCGFVSQTWHVADDHQGARGSAGRLTPAMSTARAKRR